MTRKTFVSTFGAGLLAALGVYVSVDEKALAQDDSEERVHELEELEGQVEALRRMLPSQSHTMIDVEYHFTNLWFAAHAANWPLAAFYLNETRSHLNWAVRVRAVRPLSSGGELDLRPILASIEETALADLETTVEHEDATAFESSYRQMLNECHACHVAAEKPYLRPRVPVAPASPIIDMRP